MRDAATERLPPRSPRAGPASRGLIQIQQCWRSPVRGRFRVVEGRPEKLPFGEMARVLNGTGAFSLASSGDGAVGRRSDAYDGWLGEARGGRRNPGRALSCGRRPPERGAVFYPPFAPAAALLAKVDTRIGRHTTSARLLSRC